VADEGYQGPCRVWREPNYHIGTYGAPTPHFATDESRDIIEFATRAEAEDYVYDYYNAPSQYDGIPACNVLSHGQAGADGLVIVRAR